VIAGGTQVLTNCEDIDASRRQIGEDFNQFFRTLAESNHHS